MADPRKHEPVDENSNVDYPSLAEMFAENEQRLNDDLNKIPFEILEKEMSGVDLNNFFEGLSDAEKAENRATRAINEDRNVEVEIIEEPEARSDPLATRKRKRRDRRRVGAPSPEVLPENYRAYVDQGGGSDVNLIFEKKLSNTDVDTRKGRLIIPPTRILRQDFMTETNEVREGKEMNLTLVDGQLKERSIRFAWKPKSEIYVLKQTWTELVRENGLGSGDKVQIWSFRVGEELRLALVVLDKPVGEVGESSAMNDRFINATV